MIRGYILDEANLAAWRLLRVNIAGDIMTVAQALEGHLMIVAPGGGYTFNATQCERLEEAKTFPKFDDPGHGMGRRS